MTHPIKILEHYWGYTSFRPFQEEIITAVLNGHDTLALLPTGGGKSLCFQIPALAKEGICIVISPLIALMKDQVNALKHMGIKAIALTSGLKYEELGVMLDNCIYGDYKFLYLSPERLQQEIVQTRIRQMNVNLIAVDEAHCISHWGNDFRPAYKHIQKLRELQPSVNVIALTATATPKVVDHIITELDFIDQKTFIQSFKRDNIAYMVIETQDKHHKLEQILSKNHQSAIIYVRSRKQAVEVSKYLELQGFSSSYYHGGLATDEKEINLEQWKRNQKKVMVATNAFGMGIDKPDVKTVVHINLPESIESYFQEAGRAGRNNEKAYAIILKNKSDEQRVQHQFLSVLPEVDFIKQVYRKLCSFFQIPYGEGENSMYNFDFNHFCQTYGFNTHLAYNALQVLDRNSIISLTRQYQNISEVSFLVSNTELFSYLKKNEPSAKTVKAILRTYGGIFDHIVKVNAVLIATKVDLKENDVIKTLEKLENDGIISLQIQKTDAQIGFIVPREDDKTINPIAKTIQQQNDLKKSQVAAVLDYVNNNDICKSVQLLSYFGEEHSEDCGMCNVCTSRKNKQSNDSETEKIEKIISELKEKPLSSRQLETKLTMDTDRLHSIIKVMLEEEIIEITAANCYKLRD